MAYKISDECIKCGSCADTCPNEAISEGEDTDAQSKFFEKE